MWRLWVILSTLIFSCLFQLFKNVDAAGGTYVPPEYGHGFPFSDMVLSPENYVFALFEHLNAFLISIVIFKMENKYVIAMLTYCTIQFFDLADHLLTYSTPWFDGPPTFNHLKVAIFGLSMIFEKYGRSHS
jgi:hypothetical protein